MTPITVFARDASTALGATLSDRGDLPRVANRLSCGDCHAPGARDDVVWVILKDNNHSTLCGVTT